MLKMIKQHRYLVAVLAIAAIIGSSIILWNVFGGAEERPPEEVDAEVTEEMYELIELIEEASDGSMISELSHDSREECKSSTLGPSGHFYSYMSYDLEFDGLEIHEQFELINEVVTERGYTLRDEDGFHNTIRDIDQYESKAPERESFSVLYDDENNKYLPNIYYSGGDGDPLAFIVDSECYKRAAE